MLEPALVVFAMCADKETRMNQEKQKEVKVHPLIEIITQSILYLRGQKVMLSPDLAK